MIIVCAITGLNACTLVKELPRMGHLDFTRSSPRHRRIPHTIAAHCVFSTLDHFPIRIYIHRTKHPLPRHPSPLRKHAPHPRFEVAYEHGAHASKTVDIIPMAKVAEIVPAGMACGWRDYSEQRKAPRAFVAVGSKLGSRCPIAFEEDVHLTP
ncbi:hypothetical protein EI94DRAFT_1052434 [Lactarius quietus]|nr:hypothetical protein EI94DRAFT_1052434 [Lactarius quietus]